MSCEHGVEPKLKLVFSDSFGPINEGKERLKSFWTTVESSSVVKKDVVSRARLDESKKEEAVRVEEIEEAPTEDKENFRELFELMVSRGLDRHALAISPNGYRKEPQVCVCREICCHCFQYSQFLHNLKLHDYKKKMIREYEKMYGAPQTARSEEVVDHLNDESAVWSEKSVNRYDEFSRRDSDDESFVKYSKGKTGRELASVTPVVEQRQSARSEAESVPKSDVVKRSGLRSDRPPYESKLNSVHKRLREFDPNLYAKLVKREARDAVQKKLSKPQF